MTLVAILIRSSGSGPATLVEGPMAEGADES